VPTPIHSRIQQSDGVHTPVAFTYASSGSLAAASGFISTDLYKFALVTGDDSMWVLVQVSPPVWAPVGTTSGSITNVVGQGGTTVTVTGGVATVSSSAPPFNDIFGQGGTSVTVTGGQAAVSSSVGADRYSPFLLAVADPNDPNARTLAAGTGITFSDGGAGGLFTLDVTPGGVSILGEGGTYVTSSGGSFTVSSSIYANVSSSYVVVGIDAENPNERRIVGAGGTTVTDNGAGSTLVISSTLGQSSSFYGQGGTSVSVVGASVTISSSAPPWNDIFGQGGTAVTVTGGQVAVSSSAPVVQNIVGQGGTSVSNTGPTWFVSSSAAVSQSFVGQGGTMVSVVGSQVQVSSSAPPWNDIFGQGGTAVTVTGGQVAVSSSVGANLQASFVQVALDAENTNARKLTAGSNITLTDGGAGGNLTIAASAGTALLVSSTFMAASVTVPALLSGSSYIMMKTTNQSMTATLPSPASYPNSLIVFKDIQGFASGGSLSTVLISPQGSETIDALSASYTFQSPWGSKGFLSPDGISWFTVF
jgi:hypothetical protein